MRLYEHKKIEKKWQAKWLSSRLYEPRLAAPQKPFYNLMMFPYPSAEGLHVGNMYAFTGSDIYGRFKRMQGYDVFEPIGLDGFGIHSENYALSIGKHPMKLAKVTEKTFYRQLSIIGNGFAWKERLETYDPEYYRWTQWIFLQMYKHGLAYRKKSSVNWCPSCRTVLADEQVIAGACERCGTPVVQKELEQWFFKITQYAEKLLKNLETIDWSERVKIAQRNWIGRSEGANLKFPIFNSQFSIEVFTTRPDTLFGATFMVLAPEHELVEKIATPEHADEVHQYIHRAAAKTEIERTAVEKEKTGVFTGAYAINPANNEKIPIWIADYVLRSYGTGGIMAVPAHDERDFAFAQKYKLPVVEVISPKGKKHHLDAAYIGEGILINSSKFNGMRSEEAKKRVTDFVKGEWVVRYRLRDWLISRQRYWGPPIPMIYCEKCALRRGSGQGWQPVPEKDLPVRLPFVKNFRPTGTEKSPLASVPAFYKVKCPSCKGPARRETDVSDTFLDSAWYYLGYLMKFGNWKLEVGNSALAKLTRRWLPVHMYIGGAEHAVLHLLYTRFLAMAFHDFGLAHFEEPFTTFRAHGLLIKEGAKMSKSKGNIVNPDEYIERYGADALRCYLMFLGPFSEGGDFQDKGIAGITRFLHRVWRLVEELRIKNKESRIRVESQNLGRAVHRAIKKVTEDIEGLRYNTAIAALMTLLNTLEGAPEAVSGEHLSIFLRLLAPFAPHISEELWSRFRVERARRFIHSQQWPVYDPNLIQEKMFELVVQVNGRVRDRLSVPAGVDEKAARELVLNRPKVRVHLPRSLKKVIFVPGRLINLVG